MADENRPLLAGVRDDVRRLTVELREMVRLRMALAESELDQAKAAARGLALSAGLGGVLALTGLPVLVIWLSHRLDHRWGLSPMGWMLALGLLLFLIGLLIAWLGWRRFRSRFVGFEQSLEELREDLVWWEEISGKGEMSKVENQMTKEARSSNDE